MNEKVGAYVLGGIGLVKGLHEAYVRPELSATRAWALIGVGVLAYEIACPEGELLSEGVDRALERHPKATVAAIGITALHLANLIPERLDPFSIGVKAIRRGN